MSDPISRQAAIDVINKIFPVDPMRNEYTQGITCGAALAMEYIKQLPSAEPVWTPVTERLPEKEGLYLISHRNGKVFLDKWLGDDGWDSFISVTAWMPLPEAYQQEEVTE